MTDKNLNSQIKVLVVDDSVDAADVTSMMLSAIGFQAASCNSGKQALAIASQETFNVILLDLDMPEMDGYSVCQQIRVCEWGDNLPIIAFTGHDYASFKRHSAASCFDGILSKPTTIQELETAVLRALSKVNIK